MKNTFAEDQRIAKFKLERRMTDMFRMKHYLDVSMVQQGRAGIL